MIAHSRRLNAWLRISLVLIVAGTTPLFAQISFNDFSNVSSLALNGTNGNTAQQVVNGNGLNVLRLTPDETCCVSGTAWFQTQQQSVSAGFTSVFQFQITHDPNKGLGPGDGIAFVIQNSSGSGQGTAAAGASGSAIGYGSPDAGQFGSPIPNSLAVEFDTFDNAPYDPNGNHIAVQSCGTDANTQDHTAICPDGHPANLGIVSDLGGITLADGNVHTAVLQYDPGTLSIFVDNLGTPLLVVSVDLSAQLSLNNGSAWVGFTGSEGGYYEANDILSWNFAPANTPTTVTQNLTPSQQPVDTNFVYGSYNHKLQYSNANDGDNLQVTGIPISQQTFHDTRLLGTPFANSQCVVYDGAGGNCVMFEVVCAQTQGNDCANLNYDLFNNFNTSQLISGACLLKAPIGTNNWQNIIETFTQTRNDPGTHGGSKGFSDFIVGQNCTALPSVNITSPANGSTVVAGQNVTIGFSCAPDPNAPFVTITSCTGMLNGNPVTNGQVVVFNQVGPGTLVVTATDSVQDSNSQTSNFTVGQVPVFTSTNNTTFQLGMLGSFAVTTTGFPTPVIGESGGLPGGVGFHDNGNGTGTLSGTPTSAGTFNISFNANNSAGGATQGFTLTVTGGAQVTISPSSLNFGNVRLGGLVWQNLVLKNTGTATLQISKMTVIPGQSDPDDFTFLNFCGKTLGTGKSCLVTVFFYADNLGQRTATLSITDNAPNSPQQVPLSGNTTSKH